MSTRADHEVSCSKLIHLQPNQVHCLARTTNKHWVMINIHAGILRLATPQEQHNQDITLAFLSQAESDLFQHPITRTLHLEAITETSFEIINYTKPNLETRDFLSEWLLELHMIRNPRKAEQRLKALLKLLIERLGKRTAEGFKLEFLLSHARIAEVIGTTRSTVSRSIGTLRDKGQIAFDDQKSSLTLNISQ